MNNSSKKNQENKKGMRPIDRSVLETLSWWQKNYLFVKTTKIATWKGLAIITFIAGLAIAVIWTVSMNIQTKMGAANAVLSLDPSDIEVLAGDSFEVDVVLNTGTNDVTAVRASIKYDPEYFELVGHSTENSRFAVENPCVSNNESCRIVNSVPEFGVFDIALGTPNPINTNSGNVVTLTFRAKQDSPVASSQIRLVFNESGNMNSGVAINNSQGTEVLGNVNNAVVTVGPALCIESSLVYSDWNACQDGLQTRTIVSRSPVNCVAPYAVLSQSCTVPGEICSSFTYSEWGTCQEDGLKYRTIATRTPDGCVVENADLTEECETDCVGDSCEIYGEDIDVDSPEIKIGKNKKSFGKSKKIYSNSSKFKFKSQDKGLENGKVKIYEDGKLKKEVTIGADGKWSASVKSSGNGTHTYRFVYFDSANNEVASNKYQIRVDTKDPKITDLPKFLNKSRGEKVWWKADDNHKVDHYKYTFNGKTKNTKSASMIIPVSTKPGYYTLKVTVYDKAGNSESRSITIRVR